MTRRIKIAFPPTEVDPPPAPDLDLPTVELTSSTSGVLPFMFGQAFAKGDATEVSTDIATAQVSHKRYWNDGSVKHVIVCGRASFTAGVPVTISFAEGSQPSSGNTLTADDIEAANPQALIECLGVMNNGVLEGDFTLELQSLLSNPFRTWISGPEMVECHYRGMVGGHSQLHGWFHVRLFRDGRLFVRALVENGFLDNVGSTAKDANIGYIYTPRVTIDGTVAFTFVDAAFPDGMVHKGRGRYKVERWIGGDPLITPRHDTRYLMSTKLFPNYWHVDQPTSEIAMHAVMNHTNAQETYAVVESGRGYLNAGNIPEAMGTAGFDYYLAVLKNWVALYLCNLGHPRAFRVLEVMDSHLQHRPIFWRSRKTWKPPLPNDYPKWNADGPNGFGSEVKGAGLGGGWKQSHHPEIGYASYILTGDYAHLEGMQFNAITNWMAIPTNRGQGTSRAGISGASAQDRGAGWMLRTLAAYLAVAPDGDDDEYRDQMRAWFNYMVSYLHALQRFPLSTTGGGIPEEFGIEWVMRQTSFKSWMQFYRTMAHCFNVEVEPVSDADMVKLREHAIRFGNLVVNRFGDASGYCYRMFMSEFKFTEPLPDGKIPSDHEPITLTKTDNLNMHPANFVYKTWREIWENSQALWASLGYVVSLDCPANVPILEKLGSTNITRAARNRYGEGIGALGYLVNIGVPGAAEAWARVTAAPNWNDLANYGSTSRDSFYGIPQYGIVPRGWNVGEHA